MTAETKLRIMIVDDLPVVRIGIKSLLAPLADLEVVQEASNGEAAVAAAQSVNPDVILMDVGMPIMNGIEAARMIRRQNQSVKIIMLTSHDSESDIFAALEAGADGYVLKDSYEKTLELAIRAVRIGSVWLDPAIARRVLQIAAQPSQTSFGSYLPVAEELSMHEKNVLSVVAESQCEGGVCMVDPDFLNRMKRFAPSVH